MSNEAIEQRFCPRCKMAVEVCEKLEPPCGERFHDHAPLSSKQSIWTVQHVKLHPHAATDEIERLTSELQSAGDKYSQSMGKLAEDNNSLRAALDDSEVRFVDARMHENRLRADVERLTAELDDWERLCAAPLRVENDRLRAALSKAVKYWHHYREADDPDIRSAEEECRALAGAADDHKASVDTRKYQGVETGAEMSPTDSNSVGDADETGESL